MNDCLEVSSSTAPRLVRLLFLISLEMLRPPCHMRYCGRMTKNVREQVREQMRETGKERTPILSLKVANRTPPNAIVSSCSSIHIYHSLPAFVLLYQLAFFTPGRFPASAFIRNWYCKICQHLHPTIMFRRTHTSEPKVTEDTSSLSSHNTPVLDLRESCVAVHLRQLELGLSAHSLW